MSLVDRSGLGISLRILSGMLMAGMYVSVKLVSADVPLGEIVFFRALFALIPLILFLWVRREIKNGLATRRPLGHLQRAVFGVISLFASFAALARLSVAEAVLLAQISPILTAIAAIVLLSERLTPWRVLGLALGFLGILIFGWPELGGESLDRIRLTGIILGLVSAAFSALSLIVVRALSHTEKPGAIALYFLLAAMAAALFTLPWGWVLPHSRDMFALVCAGLFGGCAHIAMTLSFRYAEASRLAPFEYVAFLWPVLAELFLFKLPLAASFLLAAPLILIGAAFATMESYKKADAH